MGAKLCSVREAAIILECSDRTVEKYVEEGRLDIVAKPSVKKEQVEGFEYELHPIFKRRIKVPKTVEREVIRPFKQSDVNRLKKVIEEGRQNG